MFSKTLIITNAVAAYLLSIASELKDTSASTALNDVEFGDQKLIADRIHPNLFVVSFVGHAEFLEKIGSAGWKNSLDSLYNYMSELSPEVQIHRSAFIHTDLAEHYSFFELQGEEPFLEGLAPSMGLAMFDALVKRVVTDAAATISAAAEAPIAHEETVVPEDSVTDIESDVAAYGDSIKDRAKRMFSRAKRYASSEEGLLRIGATAGMVCLIFIGARFYRQPAV
jgi:hypothetical protein